MYYIWYITGSYIITNYDGFGNEDQFIAMANTMELASQFITALEA